MPLNRCFPEPALLIYVVSDFPSVTRIKFTHRGRLWSWCLVLEAEDQRAGSGKGRWMESEGDRGQAGTPQELSEFGGLFLLPLMAWGILQKWGPLSQS